MLQNMIAMYERIKKVSRLGLCKTRVLKYYVKDKALLEIWKSGKQK